MGNAVKRNRVKGRLREAALSVDLRPKTAYVVVASHEVVDVNFIDVTEWLTNAVDAGHRATDAAREARSEDRE